MRIGIDQSIHNVAPLFEEIEESGFYIRSVRVLPIAWSRKADVCFSLGGGTSDELGDLLERVRKLPAVLSMDHVLPPV